MLELRDEEVDAFRRLCRATAEIEPECVIVGGQAARLLRFHPLATRLDWSPLFTHDIDLATHDTGHRSGSLAAALQAEGFIAAPQGDDVPPLTRYELDGFEVDFLVPEHHRRHEHGATMTVLGASAQRVKDLEILLIEPTDVDVRGVGVLRVPNPASYLIQKLVTLPSRPEAAKRGKDALYIHDVLLLFTHDGRLHREVVEAAQRVLKLLTKRQRRIVGKTAASLGDARTPFVIASAQQAQGRPGRVDAETFALANRQGLDELLG